MARAQHVACDVMIVLAIVAAWISLPYYLLGAMAGATSNQDIKKLLAGHKPTPQKQQAVGVRTECKAYVKIEQGKAVFEYAKLCVDAAVLEQAVETGKIRFPDEFWCGFCQNHLLRVPTGCLRHRYRKAFVVYLRSLKSGAKTLCGQTGEMKRNQRRALRES